MNRRGFTLIELLAVIVILGILSVLIVPGLISNVNTSKESAYSTLIKNIVTSSETYYEECEYGDLSDSTKYGTYACSISNNKITTTLGALANTGILNVKDFKDNADGTKTKIVKNPKTDDDISSCKIIIKKIVNASTYKVTYQITNSDTRQICPSTY